MCRPGGPAQLAQLGDLVLAERLGGEEVQGPRRGIVGQGLERGHEVAQRLARGRRRDDDDVLAVSDGLDRLGLVAVERARRRALARPARRRGSSHSGIGTKSAARAGMWAWWTTPPRERWLGQQPVQDRLDAGRLVVAHRAPQTERPYESMGPV